MFNKKEINELKEEVTKKLDETKQEFSNKLVENSKVIDELHNIIRELKENHSVSAENIKKELEEINSIKSEFERALNRVSSMNSVIESTTASSVREVAEKEIESIKASSRQFRNLEEELKEITERISEMQLEISKFISISQQIRLVDFSLKSHQEDLRNFERERTELLEENERLKTIMAKMKRNRV